jgi:GNAT superfamily N-acetyltransferase
VRVREAKGADELGVRRVLDAAMLDFSYEDADVRLVVESEGNVLGALLASEHEHGGGAHIEAVAVRKSRRAEGVGTELVEALGSEYAPVTADCRPDIEAFYESLGFRTTESDGRAFAVNP